jgi:hypothetical protein
MNIGNDGSSDTALLDYFNSICGVLVGNGNADNVASRNSKRLYLLDGLYMVICIGVGHRLNSDPVTATYRHVTYRYFSRFASYIIVFHRIPLIVLLN